MSTDPPPVWDGVPRADNRFADERPELDILEQLRQEQLGMSLKLRMPTAEQAAEAREQAKQDARAKGGAVLQEVHDFLGRFVIYPSEAAHIAHTLWVAHTYFMDQWDSTPRIAFLSPEPGSGKSRALEVTEPLVNRPVHAVNTTPAYLFRKVSDPDGIPVILYDEIDTVFGPKAKDNEDVRGMLNAGHRKGAMAGRCVVKGSNVMTEELPAYCAVALAGLDDLPDTLHSRSVIVRMRRRAPDEKAEQWRNRIHRPQGEEVRAKIEAWADTITDEISWPEMPEGVEDRNADIWESLIAVADLAGGEWPKRARVAAVALVADSQAGVPSMNIRLLGDLRDIFGDRDRMSTQEILDGLIAIDDAPWGDMNGAGRELTHRGLAQRLARYDIKSHDVRFGARVVKGYDREALHEAWLRYLGPINSPDPEDQRQTINTEDEIKVEDQEPGVDTGLGTSSDKSATSATPATADRWDTCRSEGCAAGLWHPESQQLGYCAKCRQAAA